MSEENKKNNNSNNNSNSNRGHLRADVIGRITNNPEVREVTTAKGTFKVCSNMSVAVNLYGESKPTFIRLAFWGDEAERYAKFLHKGMKVSVTGELRLREYTKDSTTKQTLEFSKVYAIENIGGFSNHTEGNKENDSNNKEKTKAEDNANEEEYPEIGDDFDNFVSSADLDGEDLPF